MNETNNEKHSVALKEYYSKYLIEVRNLKASSVAHYFDALNIFSRRLKAKNLIQTDIYEVMDLDYLVELREILFSDPDFVESDTRGNRMYSAGLNNYIRFAEGKHIIANKQQIIKLDIPIEPEKPVIIEQTVWKRSNILRTQVIQFANNQCEHDNSHQSFVAEKDHKQYMEGHHALPMKLQDKPHSFSGIILSIIFSFPLQKKKSYFQRYLFL